MKNLSLILNIILLLAVAYLFADRFSGNEKPTTKKEVAENTAPGAALKIMYLNIDTLQANSKMFQKKKAELEKQQAAAEATMRKKLKAFQNEVLAFQKKQQSGTMTPKAAQNEGERLAQKEQNLSAQQERLAQELLQSTDEFNISFNGQVRDFLDSLKVANGYDYILIAGAGSQVLTANKDLDLTKQVLEHLNKKEE
ncbi:MAG TPA: OmpH family outer membrane protein [Bacteroidetes bacterium]|nr:OmpH family outer membrane protein [Bacteroidota bacterium]